MVLKRCKETQLILNWEKCHFMETKEILLGHEIAYVGLEVDPTKIDVVSKLLLPSNIKPLWSFLGYARFYRIFIKGFSQIIKSLSNLLSINQPYIEIHVDLSAYSHHS